MYANDQATRGVEYPPGGPSPSGVGMEGKSRARLQLILVIEDEPSVRRLIDRVVQPFTLNVVTTGSGRRGVAIAVARHPDLIILDLRLPGFHGNEVISAVRDHGVSSPVIVVSGYLGELKEAARRLGVIAELGKPLLVAELEMSLRQVVAVVGLKRATEPPVTAMNASARWTAIVLKGVQSLADPRTRQDLARHAGVSLGVLREICYRLHLHPKTTVTFVRILRALMQSHHGAIEDYIDVGDHRTLPRMLERAGVENETGLLTVAEYLNKQRLVPQNSAALRLLRRALGQPRVEEPRGD